jgi:hypothetical protein
LSKVDIDGGSQLSGLITADPEVVSCELADGAALLDLRSSTYFSLNEAGAFMWAALATPCTTHDLIDKVHQHYAVSRPQCASDVTAWLEKLADANLLRIEDAPAS